MTSTNNDAKTDGGDNILLLAPSQSQSQSSSPTASSPSVFQDEPQSFNPTLTNSNLSSASNKPNRNLAPSPSLSHRSPVIFKGSSPSIHKGVQGNYTPASLGATPTPIDPSYPIYGSNPDSEREHGSKISRFYRHYILRPLQSFELYLATPDREAKASSFHPAIRRIPPWLFPYYGSRRLVVRSAILRPLCRLLILIIILALLIASTLLYSFRDNQPASVDYAGVTEFNWTINPRSYLNPMNTSFGNDYDVLLDGHSHTTYSDGRMSPETLLKWHIANGYNAVIVSDHNTIDGGLAAQKIALEKYADMITVIPGMELSCCRLHMNLIGINETIDIAITKWPTDEQLKATIDRTHELGGLVIINHIPWSNTTEYGYELPRMQDHPSREALVEMGIDGIEVANGGTDVHYPDTNANSWTILNTNGNRTAENIMAQLKAHRTSFLFDPTGTQPLAYPSESADFFQTAPPTLLGQYFQMFWDEQTGMYSFSPQGGFCHPSYFTIHYQLIGYFIAWVLVGFLLFEAGRLVVVGCIWGPFQRRRRYLQKKKALEMEGMSEDVYSADPLHDVVSGR
ncbi:hypothetical protein BGX21_000651 [Mortierella sp. AD011]|nr:hypothetical protein BGX21_000651 [Mortierella sp. AD011]